MKHHSFFIQTKLLTDTEYPDDTHTRILMMSSKGTEHSHGYFRYVSRILEIINTRCFVDKLSILCFGLHLDIVLCLECFFSPVSPCMCYSVNSVHLLEHH